MTFPVSLLITAKSSLDGRIMGDIFMGLEVGGLMFATWLSIIS